VAVAKARSHRRRSLGFQSKLLIMLLTVSAVSVLVAGAIGYSSGTSSLRDAEFQRLTQLRESRYREMHNYFENISDAATVLTHSAATIDAVKDFGVAFAELQKTPLPPDAAKSVSNYYENIFGPRLSEGVGTEAAPELYKPTSNAQTYLQNLYTVPANGDFKRSIAIVDTDDSSDWAKFNEKYQPFFADFVERFAFEDVLLLDTSGNIVYTAYKGVDLGANVLKAPYATTDLADAYRKVERATSVDEVVFTDYESYAPSYGAPTPWVVTPIGDSEGIHGALALQLSADGINKVMTSDRNWADEGLGKTGETYLVGRDHLMRSISRELIEDPERFVKDVVANGTPQKVAERQVEVGDSVLLQPVRNAGVDMALAGETGATTDESYTGQVSLVASEPLGIPGLDWALIARIDRSEALAPLSAFARNIALSTAAIVLTVCLLALIFSRILTRPVRALADAVRRVSSGQTGVNVAVNSRDEFGELASAFNDMSASLQTKQQLIEEQRKENDKLLASLMPETVADRYREGESNISTQHRDVSVIYAQLIGFDEFSRSMPSEQSVSMLNALVEAFDDAADRHGVEKVRSMQDNGLLATCGLVVPRVDHSSRTIAFAKELTETVRRFNERNGARLTVRVGIDSGAVTSGLLGERSTVYALWGEAVDLAHRVHSATVSDGVFVSDRVHRAVEGIYPFSRAGTITGEHGTETVWRLETGGGQPQ